MLNKDGVRELFGTIAVLSGAIAVVCMGIGLVLGARPEPELQSQRQAAIEYIEEARSVHERYIVLLLATPDPTDWKELAERTGDEAHHLEWVRRYDVVLCELGVERRCRR